jgi:uncharacterized protein (UPF0548 family)
MSGILRRTPDRLLGAAISLRSTLWWGVGIAMAMYRYLTRSVAMERRRETLPGTDPGPVDRPVPGDPDTVQPRAAGYGASMRRLYRVVIEAPRMSAAEIIEAIARDPNTGSPFEVSRFVKTRGRLGEMRIGDEYLVWMPGPWNGPVRVADRDETSFRLATLRGHMEAGEIEFRVVPGDGAMTFEIESAARNGSRLFQLLHDPLWIAREAQLHMWATFCERVAAMAGRQAGAVEVHDRRFPADRGDPPGDVSRRARRTLASLAARPVNFPQESLRDAGPADGWVVDDHRTPLGAEPPGPPVPGGIFETASELVRAYEFADPTLIRAIYDPAEPLDRRNMLLEGRFLGLRFHLGARVVAVVDDTVEREGGRVRRWGWSYRTLAGHLEAGQMDFEVAKHLASGRVEFRIHAVSRPARVRNPIVRAGFRLFGRGLQLRFVRVAGQRMAALTAARVEGRPRPYTSPPSAVVPTR